MGTNSTSSRVSLFAAVLCGALLRVLWLPDDILTGDELHAVRASIEWPLDKILTTWTYYRADYGIPLAALFHIAMDLGVRPGELELRTPALLAGTLSIALMPWLVRERLSPRAAVVLPWLLALSPLLALYSLMTKKWQPAGLQGVFALLFFIWWFTTDDVPGQIVTATPYIITLLVLSLATQRLRVPAADGAQYRKGEAH